MDRPNTPPGLRTLHSLPLALVLVLALGGGLWLSMATTRDYLQTELQGTARDSANTLALALRPYVIEDDTLSLETTITALVQGGHYRAISVRALDNTILTERHSPTLQTPVPAWFTEWIDLKPPAAAATIDQGWQALAFVEAQIHTAPAQQQLWRLAKGYAGLFVASMALALLTAWRRSNQQPQTKPAATTALPPMGNRREFEEQLCKRERWGARSGEEYWLLVDTDGGSGPSWNQNSNSLAGSALPELLRAHLESWSPGVQLYHLGGQEYAIYMPHSYRTAACGLAGWLCAAIGAIQPESSAGDPVPPRAEGRGLRVMVMPLSGSITRRAALERLKWAFAQMRLLGPFQWCVYGECIGKPNPPVLEIQVQRPAGKPATPAKATGSMQASRNGRLQEHKAQNRLQPEPTA
ncbi:hypothetical protein AUP74_01758 [Microbulbifer aggregans]|uniref:LapD/MoxY periplasmic domain-containing protein n=1 Tax=Microbulbifer aggregans TaxID=1769779 RepID=A0A1C9W7Q6_9GAMM|nr:LapD/MoxY N-terminal periplasmic domain-containing protein [Microbulbifer aggregans]AOS97189.1 hypothetical protein AUP74_01758 [Microbulbifer aggregans]